MAQLAPNPPTERMSRLLPTVKCSSCTQPVPLDQLGDHVCQSASNLASDTRPVLPPLKAQTAPRPSSNASTRSPLAALFPRRRPSVAATPRGASPTPSLSRSVPSRAPSRNGARSPAISLNSNFVPQPPRPPSRTQTQRPELTPNVAVPSIPRPGGSIISTRSAARAPSPLDTRSSVLRRPSNPQSPSDARSSTFRRPSNPQSPPDARSPSLRRPSNPQSSTDSRSPVQRRPSIPQPPRETRSPIQRRPSTPRSPSNAPSSILRRPSDPRSQFPQASNYGTSDDPRSALMPQSNHHPVRAVSPTPSNYSSRSFVSPEIDTKSGGAAGMAGVGRRGFAAAARAAMFASSPTSREQRPSVDMPAPRVPLSSSPQPTDDYRVNTPPLGTQGPPTAPPIPYSQRTAPHSSSVPSPPRGSRSSSDIPLSQSRASSPTPPPREPSKPSSIPFPIKPSDTSKPLSASGPLTPTTPIGQRFSSEKPSQKKAILPGDAVKVVTQDDVNPSVLGRPSGDEESEFGGLAYAEGDNESDDDELLARGMVSARVPRSSSVSSTYSDDVPPTEQASTDLGLDKALAAFLRSPTSTDTPLSPASSTKHIRASKPPMRSLTSHVQRDPPTQGAPIVRRGATISGAYSGSSDKPRNDRSSQESSESGLTTHRQKALTCLRCSKDIEDKRWISVENGRGVLCDKCWKNMYLPKCRRCNLPIEKQAVSSSDGQLKGKYHRDCFNCHTCHKPFPDKTFYVFDGKPFCDYHYHEANNSLCAAPSCGRPIEGPCAVSHAGDRYHAEHLTCEYEDDEDGERCDERLVDYWEIEGRMLCERHMRCVVERDMMGVGLDRIGTSSDSRAMKRKTQFIDLAGLR